jgi:hypothetical protein
MVTFPKNLKVVIHFLGLSSLGGALFLQTTVFMDIFQNGYFSGVESNKVILSSEIALTAFAITYLGYMFIHFIYPSR